MRAAIVGALLVVAGGCVLLDPAARTYVGFLAVHDDLVTARGTVARPDARIWWETFGAGPPVVVLHGGFGSIEAMAGQIPTLAKTRRVIAVDARGHGRSSTTAAALHYADMTDDVVAVLDALRVDRVDVVGWSDGGIVALDLALRYPARVGRIVAIGANASPDGYDPHASPDVASFTPDGPELAPVRAQYERIAPDPSRFPWLVTSLQRLYETEPSWTADDLAKITAPTLLIVGAHDAIRPAHTAWMARTIPGARAVTIAGASHSVPLERPDVVAALVVAHLDAAHPDAAHLDGVTARAQASGPNANDVPS
jgi:pimeloyl-ACP methyl ester carboxylesterase